MEHAALDLRKEYPNIDLDATVSFVERNAQEGGNYFFYDKYQRLYWRHTLIFLERAKSGARREWKAPTNTITARWTGGASVKSGESGDVIVDKPPLPAPKNEGSFRFRFQSLAKGGAVNVSLKQIEVFDDASSGSTRWIFKVFVNGKPAIHIPLRRYEDSGKPTTCLVHPQDNRDTTAPGNGDYK